MAETCRPNLLDLKKLGQSISTHLESAEPFSLLHKSVWSSQLRKKKCVFSARFI